MNIHWKVGIGRRDITPREAIALAGWGGHRISEGVQHPLWAKAIALQDESGTTAVLVTTDLLGLSREMSEELASRAAQKFGLGREQLIINSSHNHAGPVTGDLLHLYYELSPAELDVVAHYTAWLLDEIEASIGEALSSLQPGKVEFEQGLCGFGVNRRRSRPEFSHPDYPSARHLPQIVDHDVPVLAVRDENQELQAIVFGYACHPTSYAVPQLCGDWPGFAQIELEEQFPGVTAFFVAGCGGDINPLPRFGRYHEELPQMFGKILAASVSNVVEAPMQPLEPVLQLQFEEIKLPLQAPPEFPSLEAMRDAARARHGAGIRVREVELQLQLLERGPLAEETPYPVHFWQLGMLKFVALSGEPVVDYSLRFKAQYGFGTTWVAGYCNELTAYIPSLRVLREGGYEGTEGMLEYGWPSPFDETIEERIATAIQNLQSKI